MTKEAGTLKSAITLAGTVFVPRESWAVQKSKSIC